MKSTGKDVISRTLGFNSYMRKLARSKWDDPSCGNVTAYLHFYVDQGIFEPNNNNNDIRVKQAVESEIENSTYAGLAITISNIENIWSKGNEKAPRTIHYRYYQSCP
jgi:hypothetical protein